MFKRVKNEVQSFGNRWGNFVVRFKWFVFPLALILAIGMASGVKNFGFNNDYRVFFSEDNPQLKAFDALQAKYTKDDNVYVIIEPQHGKKVFDREVLKAIDYFVNESAWQTPFSSRVDALTNYQHTIAVGDDMFVEDLISNLDSKTDRDIKNAEYVALHEPILKNRLINSDGTITGINIVVKKPDEAEYQFDNLMKRKLLDSLNLSNIDLANYIESKQVLTQLGQPSDFISLNQLQTVRKEGVIIEATNETLSGFIKADEVFRASEGKEIAFTYKDVKNAKPGSEPEIYEKSIIISPQNLLVYENSEIEIASFVRREVAKLEQKFPVVKTRLSGVIMLSNAFAEAAGKDLATLIPGMYLTIIITLILFVLILSGFRNGIKGKVQSIFSSLTTTFSTVVVLLLSIMGAVGMVSTLGIKFTSVSISAPTMILTLAVADSIHILMTMLQSMKKGMSKKDAIVESMRVNYLPVLITSATTVVGFLTMNFSDSPPFRDLGNTAAIGVGLAWFLSITILPALLAILPVWVKVDEESKEQDNSIMLKLANLVIKRNKPLLIGSIAFTFLLIFFASKNELNEQFVEYFDDSIEFRRDTDFLTENLTGIYNVEFSLGAGEEGGVNNPDYLNKITEFEAWYKAHDVWKDKIIHINTYGDIAKKVNKSMHGDDEAYYKMPQNREEAAQYLLLYEMSLPFGLDLNNQINVDKSETRFTITLTNITATEFIAIAADGKEWLDKHGIKGETNEGTSTGIMFANLTQRQIYSMAEGGVWAIILISLVLIFALKSVRFGVISIIPNVIPVAISFGIWYFINGQITSGLAIVFSMTIGIVVDDTVHLFSKYLRARRENNATVEDAIRYAFKTVGTAIITTTVVLTAGFMILSQSAFAMNSGMAKLTAITIVVALIVDLFFLPALLIAIEKKGSSKDLKQQLNNNLKRKAS